MVNLDNLINDVNNDRIFRLSILTVISLTGLVLWIFRILNLLNLFKNPHQGEIWFYDFHAYYDTAKLFINGKDIYNGFLYLYAPLTILFFLPLSLVSFKTATIMMSIANIILLILTTILISKILQYYNIIPLPNRLLIFISIFLFYPISATFVAGQVNIWILFLITAFYYYLFVKNSMWITGIFLNLAVLLKVWPVILILLRLGTTKAKGLIKTFLGLFVLLTIISLLIFGINTNMKYVGTFLSYNTISAGNYTQIRYPADSLDPDISPTFSVLKLAVLSGFNINYIKILLTVVKISSLALLLFWFNRLYKYKSKEKDVLIFSTLIIILLGLLSDITRIYYGTFLVLPYILLIFIYKSNFKEKLLLFSSIVLFSIHEGVILVANIVGGILKSAVYIGSPSTYAYVLLLIFLIIAFRKTMIRNSMVRNSTIRNSTISMLLSDGD